MIRKTLPSVPSSYSIRAEGFDALDVLLHELDIDPKSAFAFVGLTPDILNDDNKNRPIDYRKFLDLLNHCAELTGRKDFGLLLSKYQDRTVIGVPGLAMYKAQNFRAALNDLIQFFHLHMNGLKVDFEEHGRVCLVTVQVVMPFSPDYRQQMQLSLGIGLRFVRRLLDNSWSPNEVFFQHREDSGSPSTKALFRCPINYESEMNGFTFYSASLDIEREQFDSEARQILYDYLCLRTRSVKRDFLIEVREELINTLRTGLSGIDVVGKNLGLGRRTLQRRLEQRGLHYSDLLEQTRMDLAQRYLRSSRIPITQISDILGYSDVSSFSRSFKRFFGLSPRTWKIKVIGDSTQ